MMYFAFLIFLSVVHGRNSSNVEFNELLEEKLSVASCLSFQKEMEMIPLDRMCDRHSCTNQSFKSELKLTYRSLSTNSLQLKCKEDNSATMTWNAKDSLAYFLEVSMDDRARFTDVTLCSVYKIHNLIENVLYNIRLWGVSHAKNKIYRGNALNVVTLKKNSIPSPVDDIYLKNLTLKNDNYEAVVGWSPNKDFSCHYDIMWFGDDLGNEEKVNVISDAHEIKLKPLTFEKNYTVQIVAKGSEDSPHESKKKMFTFATPTCLETFFSVLKCQPEIPSNFIISEKLVEVTDSSSKMLYDVKLSWSKPKYLPFFYEAHFKNVISDEHNKTEKYLKIPGNETSAFFEMTTLGVLYEITLMACSPGGCSNKVVQDRHRIDTTKINISSSSEMSTSELTIIIIGLLILLLIITSFLLILKQYRAKKKRKEERYKYFMELEEKVGTSNQNQKIVNLDSSIELVPDLWELDRSKLTLQSVVGTGAFGIVREADLEMPDGTKRQVAVKMLKDSFTSQEVRQFTQEIDIMKSVKPHSNVVSLIGYTKIETFEGPFLVVEYCSRGNLESYLKKAARKIYYLTRENIYAQEFHSPSTHFTNRTYDFYNLNLGDSFNIQPKNLLSIARQVALGMEHLAKTRVVHRDLAARNVLVCEDHSVKVSDFGLSRDIYQNNVYYKKSDGRLPIRWMALESLTHQKYTTQSDVWSFGILLWEIVTLGNTPYAGIEAFDLVEYLRSGHRLKCPVTCSTDLYSIMETCWKTSPTNRPSFTELSKSLETLLENVSDYLHLDRIDMSNIWDDNENTLELSFESYVKPLTAIK